MGFVIVDGKAIGELEFASVFKTIHFGDDFNGLENMTFGDWFRQTLDNTTPPSGFRSLTASDALAKSKSRLNKTKASSTPPFGIYHYPSLPHVMCQKLNLLLGWTRLCWVGLGWLGLH